MTVQETDKPVLEIAGLNYDFGKGPVLREVGFSVAPGRFAVLLGPNGAGKTTLISLITRLYDSRTGHIRVAGHDVKRQSGQALARIGVVFQQSTLDLDLTVRQNLRYHAALHGLGAREAEDRIARELSRFEMLERAGEKVRNLNGGHRRRVEIARALLHKPDFLLLDEPTVGLDVPSRRAIVAHAHQLAREGGITVLWATHLIDEIFDGDDVIVLHKGEIVAQGTVNSVNKAAGGATIAESFDRLTGGART
ncbi:MAG: ATP-binding cassette domain-containing protein [Alphaproteobacteria bacterium]|nr:ATP-binding cassette domain-containing protein [Alphaproteobacteria bacterium]